MVGLLLQQILSMKKMIKFYIFVLLAYLLLGLLNGNVSSMGAFFLLFASMLVLSSFNYSERCNWHLYASTMAVSRKQIVLAYYLFAGLCLLMAFTCNAACLFYDVASHNTDLKSAAFTLFIVLAAAVLFNCASIPLLLKLGSDASRFAIILVLLIPCGIFLLLREFGVMLPTAAQLTHLLPLLPLLTAAAIGISIGISIKIFSKKDL